MAEEPMENLALFKLTEEETAEVIKLAGGGTVTWLRRDGHPAAAYVQIVVVDGQVYTTSTDDRGKNKAWRRDPRTAWVFDVPGKGGVTVLGRVQFENDPAMKMRVYNAMADAVSLKGATREKFIAHINTSGREVMRMMADKYVTLHTGKVGVAMVS
jgi:Pyridoxamine 5'-phosphate oxidase